MGRLNHLDSKLFLRSCLTILLAVVLVLQPVTSLALDTSEIDGIVDFSPTMPSEVTAPKSTSINLLQSLSQGRPFHDLIDYIGYKNVTKTDMDAIRWSFILSQLATPLEESMEDVLKHDLVLQMKSKNLKIATAPLVSDKDYSYEQVSAMYTGEEYQVNADEFSKIYDTISANIRYNKLWDKYGNHFTIKSFYDTTDRKNQIGFISDYVYTNKGNTIYDDNSKLFDVLTGLYSYDDIEKSSNLVSFWQNPERLITSTGFDKVEGQRRLVPVYLGSNIADMYLQIGMMVFCKQNSASGMTYNKFVDIYGACELYADSFGNIVFYDSAMKKYRMILPNACNPVFTSPDESRPSEPMYDEDFFNNLWNQNALGVADARAKSQLYSVYPQPARYELLGEYGSDVEGYVLRGTPSAGVRLSDTDNEGWRMKNKEIDTWNEQTFIYNKWLGAAYSTKRRTSTEEIDNHTYDIDDISDVSSAYYPAYIGPILDSRIDYRNSLVFMKNAKTYLEMWYSYFENWRPPASTLERFLSWAGLGNNGTRNNAMVLPLEPYSGNYMSVRSIDHDPDLDNPEYIVEKYIDPMNILYNTLLLEGTKVFNGKAERDSKEISDSALKAMWSIAQMSTSAIIQASSDSLLPASEGMDLLAEGRGGGIAQFVYDQSLVDVEIPELLGDEGGYLKSGKKFVRTKWEDIDIKIGEPPNQKVITIHAPTYEQDYSAWFWSKMDNRLSNRFVNYPSDDIAVLSYVWLYDYLPKTIFSTYFEGGEGDKAVDSFLSSQNVTVSDNYKDNYVALPFNVKTFSNDANKTYTTYGLTLPLQQYDSAGNFYRSLENEYLGRNDTLYYQDSTGAVQEYEQETPCTNQITINSYALLLGLYKNTDTQYNVNNAVEVIEIDRTVDIAELANKVDYSITNPISVISSFISGFSQYIHNARGVKSTASFMLGISKDTYDQFVYAYITFALLIILLIVALLTLRVVLNRETALQGIKVVLVTALMITSIPTLFNLSQEVNRVVMSSLMQGVVDKTTLISVQKTIDGLVNTSSVSERNWKAYRQQFSELEDVFDDGYIQIPRTATSTGVGYENLAIDDLVKAIKYLGHGTDKYWYELPYEENAYPLYTRYSADITKYFYDNLMGQYMTYYNGNTGTDQGSVLTQYKDIPEENTTEVVDRLDRLLHMLKGGAAPLFYDTEFLQTKDVLGIARFFNQSVINPYDVGTENNLPNLSVFTPLLERSIQEKHKPELIRGVGYVYPYTPAGLTQATSGERTQFNWIIPNTKDWTTKPTVFEDKIVLTNERALKRIKNILKYRAGTFSDTAVFYTASIIIVDEMANTMSSIEYGPPSISDTDKVLRLIYTNNTDAIYNSEELMYIIQDSVKGGAILCLLVVIMEIMIAVCNVLSILACAFVAVILPICVYRYMEGGMHIYKRQIIGTLTQLALNMCALFLANLPLKVGVSLSNQRMSTVGLWVFTIVAVFVSFQAMYISFKMISLISKDFATAGGSFVVDKLEDMFSNNANINAGDSNTDTDIANINSESASITYLSNDNLLNSQETELRMEELQGDIPDQSGVDRLYSYDEPDGDKMIPIFVEHNDTSNVSREYQETLDQSSGTSNFNNSDYQTTSYSQPYQSLFSTPVEKEPSPTVIQLEDKSDKEDEAQKSDEEEFNITYY